MEEAHGRNETDAAPRNKVWDLRLGVWDLKGRVYNLGFRV